MPAKRQCREEPIVLGYPMPVRTAIGDDQRANDDGWIPPDRASHVCREPGLRVQGTERLLDIDQRRLDLDNQQRPRDSVEGQQIDAAPLTVSVVAHLRRDTPSMPLEVEGEELLQARVIGITEPPELGTSKARVPAHAYPQRCADTPNGRYGHPARLPPLEQADKSGADAGTRGNVGLTPAEAMTHGADGATELGVIHGPMMSRERLPTIQRRLTDDAVARRSANALWRGAPGRGLSGRRAGLLVVDGGHPRRGPLAGRDQGEHGSQQGRQQHEDARLDRQ